MGHQDPKGANVGLAVEALKGEHHPDNVEEGEEESRKRGDEEERERRAGGALQVSRPNRLCENPDVHDQAAHNAKPKTAD